VAQTDAPRRLRKARKYKRWAIAGGFHKRSRSRLGLGYGISALHVCEGLLVNADPTARHVALDPYQATRFADCGLQFLEEAGVDEMVELHAEESQIALPR
jgi:hypothetical protein